MLCTETADSTSLDSPLTSVAPTSSPEVIAGDKLATCWESTTSAEVPNFLSLVLCRDIPVSSCDSNLVWSALGPSFSDCFDCCKEEAFDAAFAWSEEVDLENFCFLDFFSEAFLTSRARCRIDLYQPAAHQVSYLVQLLEHWHDQA
ncbi:hypothetical protein Peur_021512 [Populus x canadensis]